MRSAVPMDLAGSFGYARALLGAAPLTDVVHAAARRLASGLGAARGLVTPRPATIEEASAAADALLAAPPVLTTGHAARPLYRLLFPGAIRRAGARAEAILAHRIEVFGTEVAYGPALDWHLDPRTGLRFDPTVAAAEMNLLIPGADPRGPWELGRAQHLVDLGVAAALVPALGAAARAEVEATISSFLDDNPPGRGLHWTSPLEAALRVISWIIALDLVGGLAAPTLLDSRGSRDSRDATPQRDKIVAPSDEDPLARRRFAQRLGGALVEHGRFIVENLEDRGVVAGNHLLGDLVGLFVIGLRLGPAADGPRFRALAGPRLLREAARQVGLDGADFEASTAYHRFVLELLLLADRVAAAYGLDAGLGPTLRGMFRFVAGYLGPDGREPGFGDGDDGRCLTLAPRHPRDHAYLLSVGAARFGEASLRPPGSRYAEEAVWLFGPAGYRAWRGLPCTPAPRLSSFSGGGVHVLRDGQRASAALRCGGYGQRGVGGHAHNDQLEVVVWLEGRPLVVDSGTFCYAADPLWRDFYRGTAAHSTLTVEGAEQSPIFDGRPFALPDGAHARLVHPPSEDPRSGTLMVAGEHRGYRRHGVLHRRTLSIDGETGAVLVEDCLSGRGSAAVSARFHLGDAVARLGADPATCAQIASLVERTARASRMAGAKNASQARGAIQVDLVGDASDASDEINGFDPAGAVVVYRDRKPFAILLPLFGTPRATLVRSWWSTRYGEHRPSTVACFSVRRDLPIRLRVAMFPVREMSPRRK